MHRNGHEFPAEMTIRPLRGQNGVYQFNAFVHDITERKKMGQRQNAEHVIVKALAESVTIDEAIQKILQVLCENLNWEVGALWRRDEETHKLHCSETVHLPSPAAEEFIKLTQGAAFNLGEGLVGKAWSRNYPVWIPDVSLHSDFTRKDAALKSHVHTAFVFPVRARNKVIGIIELFSTEIREPDQVFIRMCDALGSQIGQFVDRKLAEEELKKVESALVNSEKVSLVAQLAAGVAHEVKNPLAVLQQGAEYLIKYSESKNMMTLPVLNSMIDAIQRADRIIRGLLDLARPEPLDIHEDDLNSVIETSLLLVKNNLDQSGTVIVREFEEDLPRLPIDRSKIVQVFINLFSNALEAMQEKEASFRPKLVIRTWSVADACSLAFPEKSNSGLIQSGVIAEIEDNGPGIPEQSLVRIFDPFVTSKRARGGSGLGLSVVRNIMEMHGGFIDLKNLPGGGAKAILTFQVIK
jgi:signal transduction histidine kinase